MPLPDLIFVTNIISGEKIVMWRNFSFPRMTIVGKLKISPHVEKFQMSPHDRCGEIWNSPHIICVLCKKVAIYAKFMQFLPQFTCFHVEKNWAQKYIYVEKMTNIRSAAKLSWTKNCRQWDCRDWNRHAKDSFVTFSTRHPVYSNVYQAPRAEISDWQRYSSTS